MSNKSKRNHREPQEIDFSDLNRIEPNAAGIDVGGSVHWVAVPVDRAPQPIRSFDSYTSGLHGIADWLVACGITTVAMESTGVFWVPLYELLEQRGLRVCLVNAHHVKNVPGRKSDVLDCQWLQKLHSYGLLRASFRPGPDFVRLRTYLRHRDSLTRSGSAEIMRMQKALTLMNVQLHVAVTDITGATGMKIIRGIVAGNHVPEALAEHRDRNCKASKKEIADALHGHYCEEQLFVLRHSLELYDAYQSKIAECDHEITRCLEELERNSGRAAPQLSKRKRNKRPHKQFRGDVRKPLAAIMGVDLTATTGLAELAVLQITSEIGADMSRWPSAKHFASWCTLAPACNITGGKRHSSRRPPTAHRAAQILRMAAVSIGRSRTAMGAFYRRLSARIGKAKAVVATAAKLARAIYSMIKHGSAYVDPGVEAYERKYRDRTIRNLKRSAAHLGFQLVSVSPEPSLDPEMLS